MRTRLAILLLLAGLPANASLPTPRPSTAAAHPTAPQWKVAGITLGMTPAEVATAARAAGYALSYRSLGRSWQGEVANQVSNLREIRIPEGARVIRNEDYKKGQEALQVTYAADSGGSYVVGVNYQIQSAAIDAERFKAAALSRYGRPSLKWDWEFLYCSVSERECARTGSLITNQLPNLTVYVIDGMTRSLELRQGQAADRALEAATKAEAERRYPKKDRPSF